MMETTRFRAKTGIGSFPAMTADMAMLTTTASHSARMGGAFFAGSGNTTNSSSSFLDTNQYLSQPEEDARTNGMFSHCHPAVVSGNNHEYGQGLAQQQVYTSTYAPPLPPTCFQPPADELLCAREDDTGCQQTIQFAMDQTGYVWSWIVDLCSHFALQRQTAHYAMQYAIRVMPKLLAKMDDLPLFRDQNDFLMEIRNRLVAISVTCVFMAAKIEEIHPPKAAEFVEIIKNRTFVTLSSEDVIRSESKYLKELDWNLHPTTPYEWLMYFLAGEPAQQQLEPLKYNLSGNEDIFSQSIRLIDIALLEAQAADVWPNVLAGAALLLADSSLDYYFVADFLQVDPAVLWDCKNWLYAFSSVVNDTPQVSTRDEERWLKVPANEVLYVQTRVTSPENFESIFEGYNGDGSTPPPESSCYAQEAQFACASPSSSDNCECFYSNNGYYALDLNGPHVYHFKYGWHQLNGGDVAADSGEVFDHRKF